MLAVNETVDLLAAEDAREALRTYVDHVDTEGYGSFPEYLDGAGDEGLQVAFALSSLVTHLGKQSSRQPDTFVLEAGPRKRHVYAEVQRTDPTNLTIKTLERRLFHREHRTVTFADGDTSTGIATEQTKHTHGYYPLGALRSSLGVHPADAPGRKQGQTEEPSKPKILAGFTRISRHVISQLLDATA